MHLESLRWLRSTPLAGIVAIAALIGGSGTALANEGFIQVRAEPGIHVFVDDAFVGITNEDVGGLIVTGVTAGTRTLRFVREGFVPRDATVQVEAGRVLLYELASLAPRIELTQEGEREASQLTTDTGTIVVQCLPIECVVDAPALGIEGVRKVQDRLVARGVPTGPYDVSLSFGTTTLRTTIGVCSDDTVNLFGTFVGTTPDIDVHSETGMVWPGCERAHTLEPLFFDDFADRDYSRNPTWTPRLTDNKPVRVTVEDGYARFLSSGNPGRGGGAGLEIEVDIRVTDTTVVSFDAIATLRTVGDGCGWTCREYPANLQLTLEDSDRVEYVVRYAVNYGTALQDQTDGRFKQVTTRVEQATWQRDLEFRIRDAWPQATRITAIRIFAGGWDYDGGIDNVRVWE